MIPKKIFCFLLLQVYFCKADLQDNAGLSQSQDNDDNNVLSCNAKSLPNRKQVPLNNDALVLHSLEDNGPLNKVQNKKNREAAVRAKKPYVFYHDPVYSSENPKLLDNPNNLPNVQNPVSVTADKDSRKKEKPELQNNENNSSFPTLLSKLIEKCLTKRLLRAQKNGELQAENSENGRRSNSYDSVDEDYASLEDKNRNDDGELIDPTKAEGLRRLNNLDKRVSLINHKRVCYACTSASSPNCWQPNRLTTVKYCRSENDSCTTKTYQAGSQLVVVRDCGNTCANSVGIDPVYKSCSICKTDFCNTNGADSVTSHGFIFAFFVISFFKSVF